MFHSKTVNGVLTKEHFDHYVARALINKPSILFADEPSGNLDSITKDEIHKLFFSLRNKYGQTIIIVTHDPELASMCDRSLFIRDGLFSESGQ